MNKRYFILYFWHPAKIHLKKNELWNEETGRAEMLNHFRVWGLIPVLKKKNRQGKTDLCISLATDTSTKKARGHRDCTPIRQSSVFPALQLGAPCRGPRAGHTAIVPEDWGEVKCVVPLKLRRAETRRLKLGARRRKEKGGRDREIDYGEVSQVNMESFSCTLIRGGLTLSKCKLYSEGWIFYHLFLILWCVWKECVE